MKGFKIPAFWQAVLFVMFAYVVFDNAFPPLLPQTLMIQYMIITIIGVLLYFSYDEERWSEFKSPIMNVLRKPELSVVRWDYLIFIPLLVGYVTYGMVKPSSDAPVELRQVHPAPPASVKVFGNKYDLATLENPLRSEILEQMESDKEGAWQRYDEVIAAGSEIYYQNCFYCHDDLLDGKGHYAHGFNPSLLIFRTWVRLLSCKSRISSGVLRPVALGCLKKGRRGTLRCQSGMRCLMKSRYGR